MKQYFVLIFMFFGLFSMKAAAQEGFYLSGSEPVNKGQVTVIQDDRIDELIRRHIEINSGNRGLEGYRIRIFSESGQSARANMNSVRANFFNKYPDIEVYPDWDAPNFKLYVGDFRTRSEALKVLREIRRDYPYAFIVADQINFPSLD